MCQIVSFNINFGTIFRTVFINKLSIYKESYFFAILNTCKIKIMQYYTIWSFTVYMKARNI